MSPQQLHYQFVSVIVLVLIVRTVSNQPREDMLLLKATYDEATRFQIGSDPGSGQTLLVDSSVKLRGEKKRAMAMRGPQLERQTCMCV